MSFGRRRFTPKRSRRAFGRFARKVLRRAQEKKYDRLTAGRTPQNLSLENPFMLHLTDIPQGDGDVDREGTQVALRSIEIHVEIVPNELHTSTAASSPYSNAFTALITKIRIIVWQWFPTADPAALMAQNGANILIDASTTGLPTLSPYNHNYRRDFRILHDSVRHCAGQGANVANNIGNIIRFTKRIRRFGRRGLIYTSGSQGQPLSGAVYLSIFTDWGEDGTEVRPFSLIYHTKTNFSDT